MSAERIDGHCLCGAVRISLSKPAGHVEICHCDMCRRWTGAYYVALCGASFEIAGEDCIGIYRSSDWAERAFCTKCGSSLWYKFLPSGSRSFLAGLFGEADDYRIEQEIFVDEQASWSGLSGDHPRRTGEELIAEAKTKGFSFD